MINNSIFEKANNFLESNQYLIYDLLPASKHQGRQTLFLNPTRNDRRFGSFSLNMINYKWADFATGDSGGDLLSLYSYLRRIKPYLAAKEILGNNSYTESYINVSKSPNLAKPSVRNYDIIITKIINESRNYSNTAVDNYLNSRGINCIVSDAIKYHPNLYHSQAKTYYPAMVGMIKRWPDQKTIAVHRTYLDKSLAIKANISPNKMILGSFLGGAVMFSPPGRTLILAEGIETALSLYQSTKYPTWSVLSSSNMYNVKLPSLDITQEIIIAADHDEVGIREAYKLANRLCSDGYTVKVAIPPKSKTDFNDILGEI